jgi:hypothetical protein
MTDSIRLKALTPQSRGFVSFCNEGECLVVWANSTQWLQGFRAPIKKAQLPEETGLLIINVT